MGIGVSNWRLAQAVSRTGQLGVISGTALDAIFARRLMDGDPGGHMRRAVEHFPVPEIAERVYERYYIAGGKGPDAPYGPTPIATPTPSRAHQELLVVANFAETWLAREGHDGPVGINLLEKIQFPTVLALYGAMLGGVSYVLMGAGIPREIPGVLDKLAIHEPASIRLNVAGAGSDDDFRMTFTPSDIMPEGLAPLKRPAFLAIISSVTLALTLVKKATGRVDGFIIEDHTAGGHNAPPRGGITLSEKKEPIYGPKDEVDLKKMREFGLPFWLAGGCASPEKVQEALAAGATGVQVGTFFAFCEESGFDEPIKRAVIDKVLAGESSVFTDPLASPTGFPFKVVQLEGTLSEEEVYGERPRQCDLGLLRMPYRLENGQLGFRCAAEAPEEYARKGGEAADTEGRKCMCNSLLANAMHPQVRPNGYRELPLVTAGEDLPNLIRMVTPEKRRYTAAEVVDYLLGKSA